MVKAAADQRITTMIMRIPAANDSCSDDRSESKVPNTSNAVGLLRFDS